MSEKNIINKLIYKYGIVLFIGYLISDLFGFIKFKFGETILQTFDNPDLFYLFSSYSLIIIINIVCAVLIWKDSKKQGRTSGLIIVLTVINFLVGIVVFILKTINDKKIANAQHLGYD